MKEKVDILHLGVWGCHNLSGILQGSKKCQTGLG